LLVSPGKGAPDQECLMYRTITVFSALVLSASALAGTKASEAWFVQCDRAELTEAAVGLRLGLDGTQLAFDGPLSHGDIVWVDDLIVDGVAVTDGDSTPVAEPIVLSGLSAVVSTTTRGADAVSTDTVALSLTPVGATFWTTETCDRAGCTVGTEGAIQFEVGLVGSDGHALTEDGEIVLKMPTLPTGTMVELPDLTFRGVEPDEID